MPHPTHNVATPPSSYPKMDESDALYRLLFERNPLPMWVHDVKTLRILAVNKAAQKKYGFSHPEFLDLKATDLHYEEGATTETEELIFEGTPARLVLIRDVAGYRKAGAIFWREVVQDR